MDCSLSVLSIHRTLYLPLPIPPSLGLRHSSALYKPVKGKNLIQLSQGRNSHINSSLAAQSLWLTGHWLGWRINLIYYYGLCFPLNLFFFY